MGRVRVRNWSRKCIIRLNSASSFQTTHINGLNRSMERMTEFYKKKFL